MLQKNITGSSLSHGEAEESDNVEVALNVTPMIDVLTCLLFFLLLSFGAVVVALINASVPALSSDSSEQPDLSKTKITISVSITDKGFGLSAQAEGLGQEELDKLAKTFAMKEGSYDYQGLNDYAFELKKRYPESDSAVLIPAGDIPYEVLVKTMDATRERAAEQNGRPARIPLFPAAVVSTLVK
jgi:biopolymer transport protein ExbD